MHVGVVVRLVALALLRTSRGCAPSTRRSLGGIPTPMLVMIDVNDHGTPCHTAATIVPRRSGVVMPSCQFGLSLQLLEEDGSGIAAHLHVLHRLLVLFLACGVTERGLEFEDEVVPVQVSIPRGWRGLDGR